MSIDSMINMDQRQENNWFRDGRTQQQGENPLVVAHRWLRGRYRYVVPIAICLVCIGAMAGFTIVPLVYEGQGSIGITPTKEPILYSLNSMTRPKTEFDTFVERQITLISSERLADRVFARDDWEELGHVLDQKSRTIFFEKLHLSRDKSGQIIKISFEDQDQLTARLAVHATIQEYMNLHYEIEEGNYKSKIGKLDRRILEKENELKILQKRISRETKEFGIAGLDQRYLLKLREMLEVETLLELQNHNIENVQKKPGEESHLSHNKSYAEMLTPKQLATHDSRMADLLASLGSLETELRYAKTRFNAHHFQVRRLEDRITVTEELISERRQEFIDDQPVVASSNEIRSSEIPSGTSLEELQARHEDLALVVADLLDRKQKIESLQESVDQTKFRFQEVVVHRDKMMFEMENSRVGRVMVINEGEVSPEPINVRKRWRAAITGGILGGGSVFGLFLLLGHFDKRMRTFDDARGSLGQDVFLGLLPQLPKDPDDPQQLLEAAMSVHGIRASLQNTLERSGGQVLGITSASPNAGKTSLTLALGVSFAAAESRTLLIDFDVVGAGLTGRIEKIAHRRLGSMLIQKHWIDQEQLVLALEISRQSRKPLGEVLLSRGYITEQQLNSMLDEQSNQDQGIIQALAGESLLDCVCQVGVANLYILPVGTAIINDLGTISRTAIKNLMKEVRRQFDTILVDTGPVLGSLESSIISTEADELVLVTTRGDDKNLMEKSLRRLVSMGGRVSGVVFNRATEMDIESYFSSTSVTSRYSQGGKNPLVTLKVPRNQTNRFGPVANATAACLPPASTGGNSKK